MRGAVGARVWKRECFVMKCCMFVSCVYPVAVLNYVFCMICRLLLLDARGDHIEHRNNIRGQNASDPPISEITSLIQIHKSDI